MTYDLTYYLTLIELDQYDDLKYALEAPSERKILKDYKFLSKAIFNRNEPIAKLLLGLWDDFASDQAIKSNLYTKSVACGMKGLVESFCSRFDISTDLHLRGFKLALFNSDVALTDFYINGPLSEYDKSKLPVSEMGLAKDHQLMDFLLSYGVDVNYDNGVVLVNAIINNRIDNAMHLIEQGADIYINDNAPFRHAAMLQSSDMLGALIALSEYKDCNGNYFDSHKWTASNECRSILSSQELSITLDATMDDFKINLSDFITIPTPKNFTL
jgi:hypothetical protein